MKKSLSKKARKVIEENLAEFMAMPPLTELTRIGARIMGLVRIAGKKSA